MADRLDRSRQNAWVEHVPAIAYVREIDETRPPEALRFISAGSQVERALGIAPEELLEEPDLWVSRIHPDDLERVLATWRRVGEVGATYHLSYRMIARDGRVLDVLDEAAVGVDPATGTRSWYGVVIGVPTDRSMPAGLGDAEEKYQRLVEQVPTVIYIDEVDEHDRTILTPVFISPQIRTLLGYLPQEWIEDPDMWDRSVHPDDVLAANEIALQAYQDGTPLSIEYRMIARDGRTVWVREAASPIRDERGAPKFWQGLYIDITDLKHAEEELSNALHREQVSAERLRALDGLKNTFLQAVSHDLRTPLAAILGLALTLEREDLQLEGPDLRDLAARIANNARKLDRMVADLLDLDRLSRGIVEPNLQDVDIGAVVRDLVEELDVVEGRDIALDVESLTIPVDRPKLERIVENLIVNSVRHTPEETRVWVRTRAHDGGALLIVEDDGPGVPVELHEVVFEPFRQGPSPSCHSPGAGVGLSLVARFAELHGGRAWVEDRPGGGASFCVFLPDASPS